MASLQLPDPRHAAYPVASMLPPGRKKLGLVLLETLLLLDCSEVCP
jgi:hypothetical protein